MAYQVNKTDGTIVATVADGQLDQLSTDLTLIGKNYSGFGESLNENFIKLLENFAGTSRPTRPIRGQVWFDVSELKLKVYNGSEFLPVSSATVSNTQPTTLAIGDLWFNNLDAQLYFFDGTTPLLLGPAYSTTQGLSGLRVDSILDTLNQTKVITSLYNNGILLGIFAKDSFTPKTAIIGFDGSIQPGFNAGTLAGIKFNVTCTNAEQLGGAVATTYVRNDSTNDISGLLSIKTDDGIIIGAAGQAELRVNVGNVTLSNVANDRNMIFNVRKEGTQENALIINSALRSIDCYTGFPNSQVNVGGNLVISGNLTVQGTTTTLNTNNLIVEDKNIIIANVEAPTNLTADGAGITIKGSTDKTIAYSEEFDWLSISEDINLTAQKSYLIGGLPVIQPILPFTGQYQLGEAITAIPGVTEFGTQNVVNIGPGVPPVPQLRLENNTISTLSSNLDIELDPDGTGNVALIGSPRITGMQDPIARPLLVSDPDLGIQDAATRAYVDTKVESRPILLSTDLSDGKSNSYIITNILNEIAPPQSVTGLTKSLYEDSTVAKILCTLLSNSTTSLDINSLPPALSTATFVTPGPGTAPAITNIAFPTATISAASVSTTRIIKEFIILSGTWTHVSDKILPP
jgi:hypothetical protein